MNKMLIAIFDHEAAADAGLRALRQLHSEGDITLYDTGVIAKDLGGMVALEPSPDRDPVGARVGPAVGSLVGLLGGPLGLLIGASPSAVASTLRDFWVAGVGMDFVEEAERHMAPGKVAVVAEIEEEWVTPVNAALAPLGGRVFRRARCETLEAPFGHDIAAFKSEIRELEAEASQSSESAQAGLQTQIAAARARLYSAVQQADARVAALQREAEAKAEALKAQMDDARSDAHDRIEDRVRRVRSSTHARGAKLSQAWSLTKEALSV